MLLNERKVTPIMYAIFLMYAIFGPFLFYKKHFIKCVKEKDHFPIIAFFHRCTFTAMHSLN